MNDHCEHCGASLKRYSHKITPILVDALIKFRRGVIKKGENKIHLINDLTGENKLKPYEWKNWTKVRFHGLVAKYKENGTWVRGHWLITKRGVDFLNGKVEIPAIVKTYRNKVVSHSEMKVFIKDVIGTNPYVETLEDIVFDTPTEEEVAIVIEKNKKGRHKKGKKYCPWCDTQLKRNIIDTPVSGGSVIITEAWQCPNCIYSQSI